VKGRIFINRFKPTYKTAPSLKISNEHPKKNTRSFERGISDCFVHEQRHAEKRASADALRKMERSGSIKKG
jgi:hypothetical protein